MGPATLMASHFSHQITTFQTYLQTLPAVLYAQIWSKLHQNGLMVLRECKHPVLSASHLPRSKGALTKWTGSMHSNRPRLGHSWSRLDVRSGTTTMTPGLEVVFDSSSNLWSVFVRAKVMSKLPSRLHLRSCLIHPNGVSREPDRWV